MLHMPSQRFGVGLVDRCDPDLVPVTPYTSIRARKLSFSVVFGLCVLSLIKTRLPVLMEEGRVFVMLLLVLGAL